ncbi:MAG: M50 family metallopeptidase [Anaerolineae bacterium]|nr:M50 family metallopeptidase [Anaerolineae bacterium]
MNNRRTSLGLVGLAFVLVLALWQIPELAPILVPFRYFVTTVHELGHGLAAILSGGTFRAYEVYASGAGVATTASNARWFVIPAGYVGTAIFGAILLYLNNRYSRSKTIAVALGIGFALVTLLFARSLTAVLVGVLTAAALIGLGWKAPRLLVAFLLNVLAILTGLNAVLDIWGLINNLNASVVSQLGNVPNDAYAMAQTVGILPPAGWAIIWMAQAVLILGFAVVVTFRGQPGPEPQKNRPGSVDPGQW